MRFILLMTVVVAASFIGCVEKGADGNETTTTTTTTGAMTSTGSSTTTATQTTATNTTTTPPGPVCSIWLKSLEGRQIHSFGGSPPAAAWDITVDAEDVSVRGVKITVERQSVDNSGEPYGEATELELTTNSQGEVTYKFEPPSQTGQYRLTIISMERTEPGGEDCLYDTERNEDETHEDARTGF